MAVKRWNGSAWVAQAGTIAATSDNTVNTIVQRDGSGNFSAGAVTATSVVTSTITGNTTTATAFATTNNLTIGKSAGYTDNATNNVLSGGSITSTTTSPVITDNYSVRNVSADFDYVDHTINIGTGTVTSNANAAYKNINIGTGTLIFGGLTTVQINASGGVTNFYGNVNLPSTTLIGNVSATEIGYVDGVTSAIQTQLNAKANTTSPTLSGTPLAPTAAAGTNTTQIATTAFVQANSERLVAKLITATAAIASTETVVLSFTAPANTIVAGDVFRFTGYATRAGTSAAAQILRIRIGPTTLLGAQVMVQTGSTTATTQNFRFDALVTCRTAGASGTIGGAGTVIYSAGSALQPITTPVTVNTTISNLVEVTFNSGNASNSYTFEHAILEKLPA